METSLILSSIVSYSGAYIGFILALIAPEELTKKTKKYFILTIQIIVSVILSLCFLFLFTPFFALSPQNIMLDSLLAFALLIAIRLVDKKLFSNKTRNTKRLLPYIIFYNLSAVALALSFKTDYFIFFSYFIFLLGFPLGTLLCFDHIKDEKITKKKSALKDIIKYSVYFLIISILLSLIK